VRLLLQRGAAVDPPDANGRTPLQLAVRAAVDSYWSERRGPESIAALLEAGASTTGLAVPTGYDAADQLIEAHRSRRRRPV
jgi:ankyrin repeat protein